jgi:hypothetical protein
MTATLHATYAALALPILLLACGGSDDEDPAATSRDEVVSAVERVRQSGGPRTVSFEQDVAPLFLSRCNFCHYPLNPTGVDLTQPFDPGSGIVNRPNSWTRSAAKLLVDPADPLNSFLLDKLLRTNLVPELDGAQMPKLIPPLGSGEIAAIRQWISDGALDDERYRSTVAPIFGDGKSLGASGGSCAHCHNENGLFAPDLTRPFDPDVGVVNVPGGGNRLRVSPGAPDESGLVLRIEQNPAGGASMPFQPEPLLREDLDLVTSWVVAGAPDN